MRIRLSMRFAALTVIFLSGLLAPQAFAGRTIVVAQRHPMASDEGAGSAEQPFKTISRAARTIEAGDTVRIEEGEYRETVEVAADGTAQEPIVFTAAPGARVVVTGADVSVAAVERRASGSASVRGLSGPGTMESVGVPPHSSKGWRRMSHAQHGVARTLRGDELPAHPLRQAP
jgi:hypothetical protein